LSVVNKKEHMPPNNSIEERIISDNHENKTLSLDDGLMSSVVTIIPIAAIELLLLYYFRIFSPRL